MNSIVYLNGIKRSMAFLLVLVLVFTVPIGLFSKDAVYADAGDTYIDLSEVNGGIIIKKSGNDLIASDSSKTLGTVSATGTGSFIFEGCLDLRNETAATENNGIEILASTGEVNIIFRNAEILNFGTTSSDKKCAVMIRSGTTVNLELEGESRVVSGFERAGITVNDITSTLNIDGEGKLEAECTKSSIAGSSSSQPRSAAIGGQYNAWNASASDLSTGEININGGEIIATSYGDSYVNAIGPGKYENGSTREFSVGDININGGTITANSNGAAIGTGIPKYVAASAPDLNIKNATIYANARIGSSAGGKKIGNVNISNSRIKTTEFIGIANSDAGGNVNITNTDIDMNLPSGATNGIGGSSAVLGEINIDGGNINIDTPCMGIGAYGSTASVLNVLSGDIDINVYGGYGEGTGFGRNVSADITDGINISGGNLNVINNAGGVAIGAGGGMFVSLPSKPNPSVLPHINISGGVVNAEVTTTNYGGIAIGTSSSSYPMLDEIKISGGFVTAKTAGSDPDIGRTTYSRSTISAIILEGGSVKVGNNGILGGSYANPKTPVAADETTPVYQVTVPKSVDTDANLMGNKDIVINESGVTYNAKTITNTRNSEHGADSAGAYLYLPEGSYSDIAVGTNNNAKADVVSTAPTAVQNVVYWDTNLATTTCDVTFDPNGGSVTETARQVGFMDEVGTLPTPTSSPDRTHYNFDGWTLTKDGDDLIDETFVVEDENLTLYAKWTPETYTLTFDSMGGELEGDNTKAVSYDGKYGELPEPTRAGYDFDGWYQDNSYTGSKITSATDYPYTTDSTIFAKWTAQKYQLSFDKNIDESDIIATATAVYGEDYPTFPSNVTRAGYTLEGWYLVSNPDEDDTKITQTQKVAITDDAILYAHWEPNSYVVSFDSQGGSPVSGTVAAIYDDNFPQFPTKPTKVDNEFSGWNTKADGTGKYIEAGDKVDLLENITLFAIWNDKDLIVIEEKDDDNYSYSGQNLIIEKDGTYTVRMREGIETTTRATIKISEGVVANVNLSGVAIDVSGESDVAAFEKSDLSILTVNLEGENSLISGENRAGLEVSQLTMPVSLTIEGSGSLYAKGGFGGAGIGAKSGESFNGVVIADSPIINAQGGDANATVGGGSGIGSGGSDGDQQGSGNIITHQLGVIAKGGSAYDANGKGGDIGTGGIPGHDGGNVVGMKQITYDNNSAENKESIALSYTRNVELPAIDYLQSYNDSFDIDVAELNWSEDAKGLLSPLYEAGTIYTDKTQTTLYAVDEPVEKPIKLQPNPLYVEKGEQIEVKVVAVDPSLDEGGYKWSFAEDTGKINIVHKGDGELTVEGVKEGETSITVTSRLDSSITDTVTVIVVAEKAVPTVVDTPSAQAINYGQYLSDSAISGGTVQFEGTTITGKWSWKDSSIMPGGGEREFDAVFTPDSTLYKSVTTKVAITVNGGGGEDVTDIKLSATSKKMNVGEKFKLDATITPENASDKALQWSTSNNTIATVDKDGNVKAGNKEGTAKITATTLNGKSASCTVTVHQKVTKLRTPMTKYNVSRKKTITVPVVCDSGAKVVSS